jgi:hypothetical protein
MSFAGKWMELETIILTEINQAEKTNIACPHSFVEPRTKMMLMMIIIIIY